MDREYWRNPDYDAEIVALIRGRYTLNDEIAILRQKDAKLDEFAEYNAYCEECKKKVKALIEEARGEKV